MNNLELAGVMERIADLLEIRGDLVFKVLAYRRAADSLRNLVVDASALSAQGHLADIPGVGKAIAAKIEELLATGRLEFLERLEEEVPPGLIELLEVPDVGPRKAALFWKQGGVTRLAELEAAARAGRLRSLPGMGEKSETRILEGIEALRRRSRRLLLGDAGARGRAWLERLQAMPEVLRVETAGSLRRWKTTIGDLDIVAASNQAESLMEVFCAHAGVKRVLGRGENKASVELEGGVNLQLWVQPPERFGSLLQFVTGSKEHNVRLRELAQKQGLSLSERGLLAEDGSERTFSDEADIYRLLGLAFIPPELREDRGEIQAAQKGRLPALVETADLTADLHSHTTWSDGAASIEEMALAGRARGLKVLAITDHSSGLGIAGGLTIERLEQQWEEIDAVQQRLGGSLRLLQGAEVEIHADGGLDFPDEVLARLDVVVASMHSSLRQPRPAATARLLKAIQNPHVDIIGHPSGRLMPKREGADLDWEAVLQAAAGSGVALEINSHPARLDLDESAARRAGEMGIPISVNTDAHAPAELEMSVYGVSVARRAWLEKGGVLTAWPAEKLLEWLKKRG